MRLEKWQALGNHFLLVAADELPAPLSAERAALLCDPAHGLGADGVLEVSASESPPRVEVRVWNRDGSVAEISGNGTRIAAAWAAERLGASELAVRTGAGDGRARVLADGRLAVTMGRAALEGPQYEPNGHGPGLEHRFVSTGNPHCVVPAPPSGLESFPLADEGPRLEHHPAFPERTNVEVVRVLGRHAVALRVWERGVGETLACGSGACAAAVAAVVDGRCASPVEVRMPGGSVEVEVGPQLELELRGTAERVYRAEPDAALLARYEAAGAR